jgi:hypothetical protein
LTLLAAAQSAAGHVGPARQILANLSSCTPFTRRMTTHVGGVYKNNDDLNRILDHLRNAGLVRLIQYHPGPALDFEIITTPSKVFSMVAVTRASLCLRFYVVVSRAAAVGQASLLLSQLGRGDVHSFNLSYHRARRDYECLEVEPCARDASIAVVRPILRRSTATAFIMAKTGVPGASSNSRVETLVIRAHNGLPTSSNTCE